MLNNIIGLAGSGWGFHAAYLGLSTAFCKFQIYNPEEKEVIELVKNNQHHQISIINSIKDFSCTLIITAGLKEIVTKELLTRHTFLNIHPSLLPAYRGMHSTVWAIINAEKYLGYTIHLINEFIDDGPIVYQYKIENDFKSSSKFYMDTFNDHVATNLGYIVSNYISGEIEPKIQDKTKASWVGKRNIGDCKINFDNSREQIISFFQALQDPYPLPFFSYKGANYFPTNVKFHTADVLVPVGRILNIDFEGVWIKIRSGYIIFDKIYDESNKIVSNSFFKLGTRL